MNPTNTVVDPHEEALSPAAKEVLAMLQTWSSGGSCGGTPVPTFTTEQFTAYANAALSLPWVLNMRDKSPDDDDEEDEEENNPFYNDEEEDPNEA